MKQQNKNYSKINFDKNFPKKFYSPIKNYHLSLIVENYSKDYIYNGLILKNPKKNIYSIGNGEVILVDFISGLKKTIIIRHNENTFSIYGNVDQIFFKNKKVLKGQKIASSKIFYLAFFENEFINPLERINF